MDRCFKIRKEFTDLIVENCKRLAFFLLCLSAPLCSADVPPGSEEEDKLIPFMTQPIAGISEKVTSDLSVYRNGKYIEHVRREEYGRLAVTEVSVTGRYYILENVIRGAVNRGNRVDKSFDVNLPAAARLDEWAAEDDPYPRFRPFPSLPAPVPAKGSVWKEKITITLYPESSGEVLILPVTVQYRYDGTVLFYGKSVHQVTGYISLAGAVPAQGKVEQVDGTYNLSIVYALDTNLPLFIKNKADETFSFGDGGTISRRGFINHWLNYPSTDEHKVAEQLRDQILTSGIENVDLVTTDEGLTLRLNAVGFKPDEAVLLRGEEERLSRIVNILEKAGNGTILVIGHTADAGKPDGQKRLSVERAKAVAEILINYGIDERRLLYEGRGASEPIADNGTESGRAQNRRVEIILIEE